MATGQTGNSTSADKLAHQNPLLGSQAVQHASAMQPFSGSHFQFGQLDLPSQMMPTQNGDIHVMNGMKPFSLPSLASITANLTPTPPEVSLLGPHRSSHHSITSGARRFSPLGTGTATDSNAAAPLDDGRPNTSSHQVIDQKPNLNIAVGSRPRSHSLAQSFPDSSADGGTPKEESGSDSGHSDKKKEVEDADNSSSAKKRSRTLTTPTQQRRLMQILEQTRFPSTDLREQLARELGMTPRRVQIWFQNRRQGMKKAQEQRAEQEATTTPTADYGRARGYSFGAYPAPPDSYTPQSHQQPSVYAQGLPAYTSVATAPSHSAFESFAGHLYAPRSLARDGMPRQLPQLQLHNNASNSSLSTLNESACGDFAWSEQSASSSTWNGSNTSYSIPSGPSVVDRERMFPFGKPLSHPYESSHHHAFPSHGLSSSSRQDQLGNRNRSQTNPDFFQFGDLSHNIHSTPFSHTEAIHQPNPYHSVFRKPEEHATPTQRLVTIESECSPGRSQHSVRSNADSYIENGLRDQSSGSHGSSVWNEALSRLNLVDQHRSSPFLSKSEKSSPDSSTNFQTPTENLLNQSQNVYPIEYSTPDFSNNNDSLISRNNYGELNNGIGSISPGFKESMSTNSHHLHLTESQLIDEVNDLDTPFSNSPGHHRQRSRSYHG